MEHWLRREFEDGILGALPFPRYDFYAGLLIQGTGLEPVGGAYTRVQVNWAAAVRDQSFSWDSLGTVARPSADISFPTQTAQWSASGFSHLAFYTASSGGLEMLRIALNNPTASTNGKRIRFAAANVAIGILATRATHAWRAQIVDYWTKASATAPDEPDEIGLIDAETNNTQGQDDFDDGIYNEASFAGYARIGCPGLSWYRGYDGTPADNQYITQNDHAWLTVGAGGSPALRWAFFKGATLLHTGSLLAPATTHVLASASGDTMIIGSWTGSGNWAQVLMN